MEGFLSKGESCGNNYCWSDAQIAEFREWRESLGYWGAIHGVSTLLYRPDGHTCFSPCKDDGISSWSYTEWQEWIK